LVLVYVLHVVGDSDHKLAQSMLPQRNAQQQQQQQADVQRRRKEDGAGGKQRLEGEPTSCTLLLGCWRLSLSLSLSPSLSLSLSLSLMRSRHNGLGCIFPSTKMVLKDMKTLYRTLETLKLCNIVALFNFLFQLLLPILLGQTDPVI
jgi:hypothetical protein